LFVSRWAGRRHWRVISSKLHGSTYISELHDLPNRNYLLAELRREMPQSRSHGTAFTLIHLEIDDVEGLRGRRGTGFVDRTLSSVTDLLQRITRSSDFVAYLGDAKFAVLLNECTREQSFLYLRRIPGAISVSDGRHMLDVKMTARVSQLEEELKRLTHKAAFRDYALIQTVPGIGENLGLTILHEIGDIERFPTVKDFLSYCRLVRGTVASAGKIKGLRGAKLGNPYLRWAFGEAAVIAKRNHYRLGPLYQQLEARMNGNKFKANTVVAIKLARAVYFMLKNRTVFDPDRLVAALSRAA
jgi:diguanylate cyclase (GGDEF)-like protein